jgi:hypothetical protein
MKKYDYRVIWSEEDNEYVGLCDNFPSLSFLDFSAKKAFEGILDLVDVVGEDLDEEEFSELKEI